MSDSANNEHWQRAIIHVDMDAFFAAVEQLDDPSLRGKPVIIGGPPESRGVVSTASYEAREFGVHSAMSSAMAHRLCPHGVFLRGNHERYSEVSAQIHEIFTRFTPLVMPLSCDEAFLDVSGSQKLFAPAEQIGQLIKDTIKNETGLTASVGLAGTLFVAKIASDMDKPDGLTIIRDSEVIERLAPLPIRRMWGVGKVAEKKMLRLGIDTIGQLQSWPLKELSENFGNFGDHLYYLCRGIDPREVAAESEAEKSISNEQTFSCDIMKISELKNALLYLSDKVAYRARKAQMPGRTVQLKVKYFDFTTITRRITLPNATSCAQEIFETAFKLLKDKTECGSRSVRLIGVGISNFSESTQQQQSMFHNTQTNNNREKIEKAEIAADRIIEKLGRGSIGRGSIMLGSTRRKK